MQGLWLHGKYLFSFIYCSKKPIQLSLVLRSHSGDNGDEDPPVPIPNTEVKLVYAESTWHRAPGRIGNCRISIKNDRFLAENGHFSCVFKIFCSACFIFFVARFLLGKSGF